MRKSSPWPVLALIGLLAACGSTQSRGPYSNNGAPLARNSELAQELHAQARILLTTDPTEAESLLRRALDADLYHGAAHNNLGVLLLQRGLLYEAAQEFEWARKLLPGHPDPRTNLAIALHTAGKHDDALAAAETALEIQAGYLPAIQALAFIQVRADRLDERTADYLAQIAERSPESSWREWAKESQLKLESAAAP